MNLSDEWKLFFELSHDLLCVVDFEGRLLDFSRSWEAFAGCSRADLNSTLFVDFVHPAERDEAAAALAAMTITPGPARLVSRLRSANGSYKRFQWTFSADIEGRQIWGIAARLSTPGALENEDLRRAHQILNSIITACPHAIISVDAERKVRIWNPAAENMFGWSSQETVGGRVPFVTEASREASDAFNKRALNGESITNLETQRTRRDGTPVDLLVSAAPTYDEKNEIDGFLTVATDITEQKNLEKQFLRTQRLESVGSLVSGIAHDLNNVLAPIRMALDLFREKMPDPASQRTLDALEGCVGRGADLIRHVLTFARGVQGERVPLQLKHVIKETAEVLSQTMPKAVTIETNVPQDLWSVTADATQLHQVVMNLCVNARDAMPDGGSLRINVANVEVDGNGIPQNPDAPPGKYVLLEVADSGSGMPPEVQRKVFEPFFTTKEVGKGTGLGLSTVAAIVKTHGGFIHLYSEVGRGTSFKVYLSAIEERVEATTTAKAETLPEGRGELILLVDDESAVRDIARLTLETHGYQVVEARDGAEGVAVFAIHREDVKLVICDMDMPVMNGATMIRSLERIRPDVPVISASGLVNVADLLPEKASAASVRAQLRKPYTAKELLRSVHEVLTG